MYESIVIHNFAQQKLRPCLYASTQWILDDCVGSSDDDFCRILRQEAAQLPPAAVNRLYATSRGPSTSKLQNSVYHDLIEFVCAWCHLESSVGSTVPVKKASKGLVRGWYWPNPACYKIRRYWLQFIFFYLWTMQHGCNTWPVSTVNTGTLLIPAEGGCACWLLVVESHLDGGLNCCKLQSQRLQAWIYLSSKISYWPYDILILII